VYKYEYIRINVLKKSDDLHIRVVQMLVLWSLYDLMLFLDFFLRKQLFPNYITKFLYKLYTSFAVCKISIVSAYFEIRSSLESIDR